MTPFVLHIPRHIARRVICPNCLHPSCHAFCQHALTFARMLPCCHPLVDVFETQNLLQILFNPDGARVKAKIE